MNDSLDNTSSQADYLEKLKRQAKQRFIGAAILLLLAVIAIPFVLSAPPRVLSSDIVIDIPKIDSEPAKAVTPPTSEPTTAQPQTALTAVPSPAAPAPAATTDKQPATAPTAPLVFAPAAVAPGTSKQDDGAKAAALLSGNSAKLSSQAVKSKYVVQAGSYSEDAKLQAASKKLTQAGIPHYTQAATAKNGSPRTRLRLVGPFETREEANNAAAKVSKLGVAAIVLKP